MSRFAFVLSPALLLLAGCLPAGVRAVLSTCERQPFDPKCQQLIRPDADDARSFGEALAREAERDVRLCEASADPSALEREVLATLRAAGDDGARGLSTPTGEEGLLVKHALPRRVAQGCLRASLPDLHLGYRHGTLDGLSLSPRAALPSPERVKTLAGWLSRGCRQLPAVTAPRPDFQRGRRSLYQPGDPTEARLACALLLDLREAGHLPPDAPELAGIDTLLCQSPASGGWASVDGKDTGLFATAVCWPEKVLAGTPELLPAAFQTRRRELRFSAAPALAPERRAARTAQLLHELRRVYEQKPRPPEFQRFAQAVADELRALQRAGWGLRAAADLRAAFTDSRETAVLFEALRAEPLAGESAGSPGAAFLSSLVTNVRSLPPSGLDPEHRFTVRLGGKSCAELAARQPAPAGAPVVQVELGDCSFTEQRTTSEERYLDRDTITTGGGGAAPGRQCRSVTYSAAQCAGRQGCISGVPVSVCEDGPGVGQASQGTEKTVMVTRTRIVRHRLLTSSLAGTLRTPSGEAPLQLTGRFDDRAVDEPLLDRKAWSMAGPEASWADARRQLYRHVERHALFAATVKEQQEAAKRTLVELQPAGSPAAQLEAAARWLAWQGSDPSLDAWLRRRFGVDPSAARKAFAEE